MTPAAPSASVIIVAYGVTTLDLGWAASAEIGALQLVVVHNDDRLPEAAYGSPQQIVHIYAESNLGFAAGNNLALPHCVGDRVILCNPDANPTAAHIAYLAGGDADAVRTVPIIDFEGVANSVVSRYPTPASLMLTALRLGRFAPRGGTLRRFTAPLLGQWGRAHTSSLRDLAGTTLPLAEYWCAGTLCSFERGRLRAVGGFDEGYFLYREDIDLCRRLASHFPTMRIEVASLPPATHAVGGSVTSADDRTRVRWARWDAATRYSATQPGLAWTLARLSTGAVAALRAGTAPVRSLACRRAGRPSR